ncbi:unnamed protein product [Symbiodinium sp. CCMP2592]|nr:unnamed protein product [Symbiodinium sp. CCMP2592]
MLQRSEAIPLHHLTEAPAGWDLATVIDAFVELAVYGAASYHAARAREVVSLRLVELWASQPEEAEAWLERCRERFATELDGKEAGQQLLGEALLRHGAAEHDKYGSNHWRFSEAGLLRGELRPAAQRERLTAWYLQHPHIRDRCRELAEQLVTAEESSETARKRQKLEQETSERRRLEAELQTSQEECRDLRNRLAAAEAQVSSKDAELRTAQSESAGLKEQCESFATRAAAGEAAVTEMQMELGQLQEEHSKCQEHYEELAKCMEAEAKEILRRLQEDKRSYQDREHCPQAEAHPAWAEEAGSKAEMQLQKAVLEGRCEQLRQQLVKAEAKLDLMQGARSKVEWQLEKENAVLQERCEQLQQQLAKTEGQTSRLLEEKGMYQERLRGLEDKLTTLTKAHLQWDPFAGCLSVTASDDGSSSSEPHCFVLDAIFRTRLYDTDYFIMGRDLKMGSQVVAGNGKTILTVTSPPKICDATEIVHLQAGDASLDVTPDHRVQVPDATGEWDENLYRPAGALKTGDLVMLDSGEPAELTDAKTLPMECSVVKIRLDPHLPVAVFSRPACIVSLPFPKKKNRRGRPPSHTKGDGGSSGESMDGGASIPSTAPGEYGK